MHGALFIAEILQHIFHCFSDEFYRIRGSSGNERTLSTLARTCKTFKEPALDALWENIASLDPFIKCLPYEAWKFIEATRLEWNGQTRHIPTFTSPLTAGDRLILRKYTPRVRRFHMTLLDRSYLDALFELSLATSDSHHLFPNLKHLNWVAMPTEFRPYLRMFLPTTLESLSYIIGPLSGRKGDASMLAAIGTFCPDLKKITVGFSNDVEGGTDAFSRSVLCWKRLTVLHCREMTDEALVHIARLPTLQGLSITLYSTASFADTRSQVDGIPFGNVTTLKVIALNLKVFIAFTTEMALSLVDVELWITDNDCSESAKESFDEIAKGNRSLCNLRILSCRDQDVLIPPDYSHVIRGRTATISTFQPLFKFHQLRVLDVTFCCSMVLSDFDIMVLAYSFPLIEVLLLNANYGWESPSPITFVGILSVIRLCPKLQKLGIEFDATATDPIITCPSPKTSQESTPVLIMPKATDLKAFYVGNSPIKDAFLVGRYLSILMPNLDRIYGWKPRHMRNDDPGWVRDRRRFMRRWANAELVVRRLRSRDIANADPDDQTLVELMAIVNTDVSEE
ncbi:hypothetical protein CONPUDRAFT_164570 [Coniophora puteana RWD-64-598 SS2]|uniref:F-box domain-containing protein n=1 Tax=Coniophora puteana (strain RWD-64-598) TaxID=741705 RepID=A0A5M3MRM0_CONPW|nr:uncharacterized protein CONPUDRAFT_164570 [Coniophora puteana RWD-64-598 SS2]EIW81803.1 hypothetical protein CONPUDRAFT_164570 [Coniophora puteana RWD-64-598 SS2]